LFQYDTILLMKELNYVTLQTSKFTNAWEIFHLSINGLVLVWAYLTHTHILTCMKWTVHSYKMCNAYTKVIPNQVIIFPNYTIHHRCNEIFQIIQECPITNTSDFIIRYTLSDCRLRRERESRVLWRQRIPASFHPDLQKLSASV